MLLRHVTAPEGTFCVERVDGVVRRVLTPGRHRRPRRATYVHLPAVDQLLTLAVQRVPDADGVVVQASATVRWRIVDPVAHLAAAEEPADLVYLAAQLAVRDVVGATPTEELVRGRGTALDDAAVTAATAARVGDAGLEVRSVVVKDLLLPTQVREALAEQVTARLRGNARLEAARAEVAALRALSNGARLLAENPALARIRLVEAVPPGSTIEIGV